MGLQKTIKLIDGNVGEYWRINDIIVSWTQGWAECSLCLYTSRTNALAGEGPLEERRIRISGTGFDFEKDDNLVGEFYSKIKASREVESTETNWFADATDVLEE